MKNLVCLLTCLFAISTLHAAEVRTWTSGKFVTEAEFVAVNGDSVTLKKTDGKEITVVLSKLSDADQEYVTKITTTPLKNDGPLQPPTGKWAKSQFQSMQTRSKNLADQSENVLKQEAEKGKTDAQIRLGLYCFEKKREADAMTWWRQAAEQGDITATSYLAVICFAKRDYVDAKKWTQTVADKGNEGAKEFLNEIEAAVEGKEYAETVVAKEGEKSNEQGEKQRSTFDFDELVSLTPDVYWWRSIQDKSKRNAKQMATDMKDTFFIAGYSTIMAFGSSLASAGLKGDAVIVSFNGKRFKNKTELREWIDKESPDTLDLVVYTEKDNYQKSQKGKVKSKELLAREFAQQMERGNVDNDERSKIISAVAQSFQGQDRETVIKGLMQCKILSHEKGQQYSFAQWRLTDHFAGGNINVYVWGWIDLEKKEIHVYLALDYYAEDWIFADSFWVTDDAGFNYQSGKVDFERKVDNASVGVYCHEKADLPLVGKTRSIIESLINDKDARIIFGSKGGKVGGGKAHWSAGQLKDVYEAIQVIEHNFENP